ncbi:zinc finger, CCHC-type containing protein, partial [Tanacetum coccineum]
IIHETMAPNTPQQNGVFERKNRALAEMVNSMLSYSGFSEGFWGEVMLRACYLLNIVPNKRNKVVRLPEPKRKILSEKVEGSRDEIGIQYSYCYSIEEDPKTLDEAMQSRIVALWK